MKNLSIPRLLVIGFFGLVLWPVASNICSASPGPQVRSDSFVPRSTWLWWAQRTLFIGVGDSLTQGTRDATNNKFNTENAYLQKIADKLGSVFPLKFSQPFLDESQNRINPFTVPTNLGVDGEDIFFPGWPGVRKKGRFLDKLSHR